MSTAKVANLPISSNTIIDESPISFPAEELFELEKRAILNQSWLYIAHSSQLKKAGDYCSFSLAGIQFFLIKNKQNQINCFHNVCRHRAYPVIRKEKGSSIILGCKYHGWSYNTDGLLTKAPHFNNVDGFVKSENSLYKINTHVTSQGLVFINFDRSAENNLPIYSFDQFFNSFESKLADFDINDYTYTTSYTLEGDFNWKAYLHSNDHFTFNQSNDSHFKSINHFLKNTVQYNPLQHESTQQSTATKSWFGWGSSVETNKVSSPQSESKTDIFTGTSFILFPLSSINVFGPAWYSLKISPVSHNKTTLQYDIYSKNDISDFKKNEFIEFIKQYELRKFNHC
ncbi:aromatic ring-hydroxylating oxygenase subunit alpha, partial [Ascoidea rubescens DSM 1968]